MAEVPVGIRHRTVLEQQPYHFQYFSKGMTAGHGVLQNRVPHHAAGIGVRTGFQQRLQNNRVADNGCRMHRKNPQPEVRIRPLFQQRQYSLSIVIPRSLQQCFLVVCHGMFFEVLSCRKNHSSGRALYIYIYTIFSKNT